MRAGKIEIFGLFVWMVQRSKTVACGFVDQREK